MSGVHMMMSFHAVCCPPVILGTVDKNRPKGRKRSAAHGDVRQPSISTPPNEKGRITQFKKINSSGTSSEKCHGPNFLLSQANTVGIIGGTSVLTTLIFLEKLVWWSLKDGEECIPFVVCSDSALGRELPSTGFYVPQHRDQPLRSNGSLFVENLKRKREFIEQAGAQCIVVPCHYSHAWYAKISKDFHFPFLHVGDCVAREVKQANLKPLEVGTNVRIGVIATDLTLIADIYQEKLQAQGFEVVFPDNATMEHIILPAAEALSRKDTLGAQNLLRIAIQILLVRAVNLVILACDDMQCVLPHNDPLLKKCIDPMDVLARSAIGWAKSVKEVTVNVNI